MPRHLLLLIVAIVASQAWPISRLVPAVPAGSDPSRSPSSDVLMQSLPFPNAAARLDVVAQSIPRTAGVVVAHASADQLASAYFVLAMRLWPRQVSYVACQPSAQLEQFRSPHTPPAFTWRIDLWPGHADPIVVTSAPSPRDAASLCSGPVPQRSPAQGRP